MTHPAPVSSREATVIKALYFCYFGGYGMYAAYVNVYYHNLGMTGLQVGWINAVAPLAGMLAAPLWGLLHDRFGKPRLFLSVAVLGSIVSLLFTAFATTFYLLVTAVGLYSLFNTTIIPSVDTLNLNIPGGRHEDYGRQRIWGTIGYVITAWLAGFVLQAVGLRAMFAGFSLMLLVMFAAIFFLPPRQVRVTHSPRQDLRRLVTRPAWLLFSFSIVLVVISSGSLYSFLSIYLQGLGASPSLIGSVWSVGALSELPVMFFSSFLLRRLGIRGMLSLAYAALALRFVLYALMPSPVWAVPIGLLHFFTFGMYWVASVVYVNQMAPDSLKTTAQSLMAAAASLASMLGAPISGFLFDRLGGAQLFLISAAVALLALGVLWLGFWAEGRALPVESLAVP